MRTIADYFTSRSKKLAGTRFEKIFSNMAAEALKMESGYKGGLAEGASRARETAAALAPFLMLEPSRSEHFQAAIVSLIELANSLEEDAK